MTQPECTERGVKRVLGRSADDPVIAALRERVAHGIEEAPDRTLGLRLGQELHRPEALAAALLGHLVDIAEQGSGQRPTTGVLTCPYWYGPRQRKALIDAASSVGLRALQVISEAVATALSLTALENRQRVVGVVDAEAGGCTASVLEVGPHRVRPGDGEGWAAAWAAGSGLRHRRDVADAERPKQDHGNDGRHRLSDVRSRWLRRPGCGIPGGNAVGGDRWDTDN